MHVSNRLLNINLPVTRPQMDIWQHYFFIMITQSIMATPNIWLFVLARTLTLMTASTPKRKELSQAAH